MSIIILDGKEFTSEKKVHQLLKEKLELPDYYGDNFNALWDCLTGWVELPLKIIWNDYKCSEEYLGDFAVELKNLFLEAENEIEELDIDLN